MTKVKRKIIKIDTDRCDGCGDCIPACPEQAIEIVDTPNGKKAQLAKDFYCDGIGACLGSCPQDALKVVEAEAEEYDDKATVDRIKQVAPEKLDEHKKHMEEHAQGHASHHASHGPMPSGGCPGAQTQDWDDDKRDESDNASDSPATNTPSALRQWPIQLHLIGPQVPYFREADLLVVADCVPFSYPDFHKNFLKGKKLVILCPKLDHDQEIYTEKLKEIFMTQDIRSITTIRMEVPCCTGVEHLTKEAIEGSGKDIPISHQVISLQGKVL